MTFQYKKYIQLHEIFDLNTKQENGSSQPVELLHLSIKRQSKKFLITLDQIRLYCRVSLAVR